MRRRGHRFENVISGKTRLKSTKKGENSGTIPNPNKPFFKYIKYILKYRKIQ